MWFKDSDQARLALGDALNTLGQTYPLIDTPDNVLAKSSKEILDIARVEIEQLYPKIRSGVVLTVDLDRLAHNAIIRAKVNIKTVGESGYINAEKFNSLAEHLEKRWGEVWTDVGEGAAKVLEGVGNVAGKAVGGLAAGLGLWTLVLLAGIGLYVYFMFLRRV